MKCKKESLANEGMKFEVFKKNRALPGGIGGNVSGKKKNFEKGHREGKKGKVIRSKL